MIENLTQKIASAPNSYELVTNHSLKGLIKDSSWENDSKKIKYRNTILLECAKTIQEKFPKAIFLKGMGLIGLLYDDIGERFMSDIDILINGEVQLYDYLLNEGFEEITEPQWEANNFKREFQKTVDGVDVVIETHERLFFHSRLEKFQTTKNQNGIQILEHELNLAHICGHLGFQHNFLKLYWLVDIDRYLKRDLNIKKLLDYAKELEVLTSTKVAISLLGKTVPLNLKEKLCLYLIDEDYLLNPYSRSPRYLVLKIFLKDSILTSINYIKNWLLSR